MEWTNPHEHGDHAPMPLERPGFDLLRAMIAARQTATPTVRALVAALRQTPAPDIPADERRIRLLSHGQAGRAGQFRSIGAPQGAVHAARAETDHAVNHGVSTNVESCAVGPEQRVDDHSQIAGVRNA